MSEGWVFMRAIDAETLVMRALRNFVRELWFEYDQRNVRNTMHEFLEHVASMPRNVPVVKIDRYFVRVYKHFAQQPRFARARLTILRGFAESYSYLTRSRARDYWAMELLLWSQVYARSDERMEELYEEFLDTGSLAENFEEIKKAVSFHLFVAEKWHTAQERSLAAEEDYMVVERNLVYWDPPYQNPPQARHYG